MCETLRRRQSTDANDNNLCQDDEDDDIEDNVIFILFLSFFGFDFRAIRHSAKQKLILNWSSSAKGHMQLCIKVIASEYLDSSPPINQSINPYQSIHDFTFDKVLHKLFNICLANKHSTDDPSVCLFTFLLPPPPCQIEV